MVKVKQLQDGQRERRHEVIAANSKRTACHEVRTRQSPCHAKLVPPFCVSQSLCEVFWLTGWNSRSWLRTPGSCAAFRTRPAPCVGDSRQSSDTHCWCLEPTTVFSELPFSAHPGMHSKVTQPRPTAMSISGPSKDCRLPLMISTSLLKFRLPMVLLIFSEIWSSSHRETIQDYKIIYNLHHHREPHITSHHCFVSPFQLTRSVVHSIF